METTLIEVHCHCKRLHLALSIPSSCIPLSSAFCSCSSCRHSTGQLAASFAVIPLDPATLDIGAQHLSQYATSNHRIRHFCPQCSANILDFVDSDGMWRVCTGIMDETAGLLKRDQIWIGDNLDGGLALWLKRVGTRCLIGPGSEVVNQDHKMLKATPLDSPLPFEARLTCRCHCGDVEFAITAPSNGEKYTAGIDTCTSCRLTTGFELTAWTSVPLDKVQMVSGRPLDFSMKSLQKYSSSPEVYRYFCEKCGAAIFVAKDNQSWIDIAAGLLRAEEGARAERWLNWNEVGFPDEATDHNLVATLLKGIKA